MSVVELNIQKLLEELDQTDRVADELVRKWGSGIVNEEDLGVIASFLCHCGYYPTVIDLCLQSLSRSEPIPWRYFTEALKVIIDDIDYSIADAIHQEAESSGHMEEFALPTTFHAMEPGLKTIRTEYLNRKWGEYLQQKNQIDEQLQFLRMQRMMDQEQELLNRFDLLFPNDPDVTRAKQDFEERWAREIVQRNAEAASRDIEPKPHDPPEVEELMPVVGQSAVELGKEDPSMAYDLAIALAQMEIYEPALEVLEFAPDSLAKTWLRLELLLPARRFIEALSEVADVEIEHASDPEITFAATYYRALALWGAGQRSQAIDLMKSLVSLKPNYRAATLKLSAWMGSTT